MLGKHGTVGCCSFECSLSCDKTELWSLLALMSRGEWERLCWVLSVVQERHAFMRGCSLSPKEDLLRATLPVLPAFAPSHLVSAWLQWCRDGVCAAPPARQPFPTTALMRDDVSALNYSVIKVSGRARV